jgi:hypothetical protein
MRGYMITILCVSLFISLLYVNNLHTDACKPMTDCNPTWQDCGANVCCHYGHFGWNCHNTGFGTCNSEYHGSGVCNHSCMACPAGFRCDCGLLCYCVDGGSGGGGPGDIIPE